MKRLNTIFWNFMILFTVTTSCESILDTESNMMILPSEHQLNSPNDTLYSMIGIFTQLEKLADRYVLLGELRGDLMDVTSYTDPNLLEIYNHEISKDNPYNKIEDFYAVINNCNYLICNIDTSIMLKAEKVMYKEFAAAKSIRAWTYFQIALNYGNVKYYEQPILTVKDADNFETLTLNELIPLLIQDLEPYKHIDAPGSIKLTEDLESSNRSYFPIQFVLGELYLWNGEYERAAVEYHDLIVKNEYYIPGVFRSTWTVENGVFVERSIENNDWPTFLSLKGYGQITIIASANEYEQGSELDRLSWNTEIIPSEIALNNWANQIYYFDATTLIEGDLRGDIGSYISPYGFSLLNDEWGISGSYSSTENIILKYNRMTYETAKAVSIFRTNTLYLRYAEAVNRAGKPNLAFAALKNGLNSETLVVDSIVPPSEKYSTITTEGGVFYDYVNFEEPVFDFNIGIHGLGCGNVNLSLDFVIPELNSKQDSIIWVENKIVEELALETAFEGNRFHDLMRIAKRNNNPSYLANKVAEKYENNQGAIRTKLMDENNWYLP